MSNLSMVSTLKPSMTDDSYEWAPTDMNESKHGLISRGCGLLCYVMSTWLMSTCANSNAFSSYFPTAHRPTAGLYLQGLLTQFHCSMKLNLILTCVTSYQFFFRAP